METPPFKKVLIVMFENQYRSYVMQDPFMEKLRRAGADMTNYFGAFHPSQTNYIASLAGEVCAVTNDTPPDKPLPQQTMVDVLEAKGVSWKAYMEAMPGQPWNKAWEKPDYPTAVAPYAEWPMAPGQLANYFRKHNAFASFHTIQKDEKRWDKIVDEQAFWADLNNEDLPEYSWFTPDIWNDGHYLYNTHIDTQPRTQLVPQLSTWLQYTFLGNLTPDQAQGSMPGSPNVGLNLDVDLLLTDPETAWKNCRLPEDTLLVVTFDEADYDATGYDTNYDGPNQIYTVLLGHNIKPGTVWNEPYNHYSLMRTIQRNFGLDSLGKNDAQANSIRGLWGETFSWSTAAATPISIAIGPGATQLAATVLNGTTYVLYGNGSGALQYKSCNASGQWGEPIALANKSDGDVAMAAYLGNLYMVTADSKEGVYLQVNSPDGKMLSQVKLTTEVVSSLAMTPFAEGSTPEQVMLVYARASDGCMFSLCMDGDPQTPMVQQPTNQYTDGPVALAQFGPSLYLVYKERNTRNMRMNSYNLGAFNAFAAKNFKGDADPENDTTQNEWGVQDFVVGHFAKKFNALRNEYQCRGSFALAAIDGAMHLVHREGYTDKTGALDTVFGLTGIFTAKSQWTNGYGTLDQAGWTPETPVPGVSMGVASPMAMASDGNTLTLFWLDDATNVVKSCTGSYVKS